MRTSPRGPSSAADTSKAGAADALRARDRARAAGVVEPDADVGGGGLERGAERLERHPAAPEPEGAVLRVAGVVDEEHGALAAGASRAGALGELLERAHEVARAGGEEQPRVRPDPADARQDPMRRASRSA